MALVDHATGAPCALLNLDDEGGRGQLAGLARVRPAPGPLGVAGDDAVLLRRVAHGLEGVAAAGEVPRAFQQSDKRLIIPREPKLRLPTLEGLMS